MHNGSIILSHFPPVDAAFLYGSAALPQANYNNQNSMLDMILVVKDALWWHSQNRLINPNLYGHSASLDNILQRWGASIYYKPGVDIRGSRRLKYGVIQLDDYVNDLLNWRTLYIAGRLHKPFIPLKEQSRDQTQLIKINRMHATRVAQLMLPTHFTLSQFLHTVVAISYQGDFRMLFGEDPRKIDRIVMGQFEDLAQIYRPLILGKHSASSKSSNTGESVYEQEDNEMFRYYLLSELPTNLRNHLQNTNHLPMLARMNDSKRRLIMLKSISSIVRRPALTQAVKGFATAGISNSLSYAMAKVIKRFK